MAPPAVLFLFNFSTNQLEDLKNAIIVGAGIGGLAAAIRLAAKGYAVQVYEASGAPGGKLGLIEGKGFRFDKGPSLFTLPALVDELFRLCGEEPTDHFEYQELEEACRYFFADGTRLTGWADPARFAQEVEQQLGEPADRVLHRLNRAKRQYDLTAPVFLERSLHKVKSYLKADVVKAIAQLYRLDMTTSMDDVHSRQFSDPRMVQLFNRFATYNGSNPYKAPGILGQIAYLEHGIGAAFPKGGMHSITRSLVGLAERQGVKFHYNTPVASIVLKNKKAVGVEVDGTVQQADLVVSNMDITPTYRRLMPNQKAPERTLQQERSSSALIFYWGLDRSYPAIGLHNILFSQDYATEFDFLFQQKTIGPDPTVYINCTSKFEKGDAPPNGENWFVMVNAPTDVGQDWDAIVERTRSAIIKRVETALGEPVADHIVFESVWDPPGIAAETGSAGGSIYGTSSNNRMAAFLRHPNFSRSIDNLYFCGGSVHPGGGIPLCLLSAKIATGLVAHASH